MPNVTKYLIIANLSVYALQLLIGDSMIQLFALWPIGQFHIADWGGSVGFQVWQLVTYAFLHSDLTHIAFNMVALYMFGRDVENELGSKYYLLLYLVAVITAGLVQLLIVSTSLVDSSIYPTIGASGGVFGVLLAYGMLFPTSKIFITFPPMVLPAIAVVIIYAIIELFLGVTGTEAGVAHFAHLGGILGGYIVVRTWQNNLQQGQPN